MIQLQPINRFNWTRCAELRPAPDQAAFMPSNLYSLAQSAFEPSCEPYGIFHDEEMVGFLMICKWNDVYWITRIMVDEIWQNHGFGRLALQKAVDMLKARAGTYEIRTTVARRNAVAEYLFRQAGFQELEELDEHEMVLRLDLTPAIF